MKIIFNGPEEDAQNAVALILRELPSFERGPERLGWGWVFPLANRHRYFLRQIKGGVSATFLPPETPERSL